MRPVFLSGKLIMSNHVEQTSKRHLFIAVVALVAFPLLPSVMGLYSVFA